MRRYLRTIIFPRMPLASATPSHRGLRSGATPCPSGHLRHGNARSGRPVHQRGGADCPSEPRRLGAGHVNKAAAGNDAAFALKTGFSARALIGLLGNDEFSFKVSPDGSAFFDALKIDRTSGQVELPQPTILPGLSAAPSAPPSGKAAVYARNRAGAPWIDVMRSSGRDFPLQPHFGVNRIANWSPSVTTTITTEGLPITSVGTVSTPTLAATNLAASMRRWRLTSAAVADSAADQRSACWACWRGNAAGLGGWTFVTRISLTTLKATGMGFFGLYGSTAALATTLTLSGAANGVGIGFQRGTHTNWHLVTNVGSGAPSLTDLGARFPVNSITNVPTLTIAAAPNSTDIGLRVVGASAARSPSSPSPPTCLPQPSCSARATI